MNNVAKSPYDSIKKLEWNGICMALLGFPQSHKIVTDSQYAIKFVLCSETTECILDESELT